MSILAINTRYHGCLFRSRLEARWAVFFDALRLSWDYEPEGFDVDGEWYLPDFYIRDWKQWVEIKPWDAEHGYLLKPSAFAWGGSKSLLLIRGTPWPGEHVIEWLYPPNQIDFYDVFTTCRRCDAICVLADSERGNTGLDQDSSLSKHTCEDHDKRPVWDACLTAYEKAHSARFEHGESGTTTRNAKIEHVRPKASPEEPKAAQVDRVEVQFLEVLLGHPGLVPAAAAEVMPSEISHPGLRRMVEWLYASKNLNEPWPHIPQPIQDDWLRNLDNTKLIGKYAQRGRDIPEPDTYLKKLVAEFKRRRMRPQIQELEDRLRAATDDATACDLLRQLQHIAIHGEL